LFCFCFLRVSVVCSSSIYAFWLPLWYLQTLLVCFKFWSVASPAWVKSGNREYTSGTFEDTTWVIRSRTSKVRQYNGQRTNSDLQKTDWATLILQKGDEPHDSKQFLLHWWHPPCYSCYKTEEKSWMKKGPNCDLHNTFPEFNHMIYTGVHISNEGIYDNVGDKSSNRINLTSFLHHINIKDK
jgi:hypothetical protein